MPDRITVKITKISLLSVLATMMPGGPNFNRRVQNNEIDCLDSCPAIKKTCNAGLRGKGPDRRICSSSWRQSVLTPDVVDVLFHIFNNFDYYNQGDQTDQSQKTVDVVELRSIFYDLSKTWTDEYLDKEIIEIINSQESKTTKKALIDARRGQGRFRADLIDYWKHGCAFTRLREEDLLRASHIKPWCDSTDEERLDVFNGLLLIPNLDLAFDKGFITY
jgi:hypothetical protein